MEKNILLPDPRGLSREEILEILMREEYGQIPAAPHTVTATLESCDKKFCAGKADLQIYTLRCDADFGTFSFPLYYVCPNNAPSPVPAFIHINFRDLIPDRYQPTEELIDAGYATLTFCYKDVTSDDGDFSDGLAGVLYPDGVQTEDGCGKLGMWAWAARAVMDFAQTRPELDHARIAVAGHSRLGKTALLTGAIDPRVSCAFSNDSGCSGAAIARENTGETVRAITKNFPFWFCKKYFDYIDNEDSMPFDQHYLLAANAPHAVYVASAVEDLWACPENEYLSCVAASEYYENAGVGSFVHPDRLPVIGDAFHEGRIGYHLRAGKHYFSREDWLLYLAFRNKNGV
jgi:hypothetical protein